MSPMSSDKEFLALCVEIYLNGEKFRYTSGLARSELVLDEVKAKALVNREVDRMVRSIPVLPDGFWPITLDGDPIFLLCVEGKHVSRKSIDNFSNGIEGQYVHETQKIPWISGPPYRFVEGGELALVKLKRDSMSREYQGDPVVVTLWGDKMREIYTLDRINYDEVSHFWILPDQDLSDYADKFLEYSAVQRCGDCGSVFSGPEFPAYDCALCHREFCEQCMNDEKLCNGCTNGAF